MALVGGSKKIDIPHEPGEWFEIKKLSWRQLELASDIKSEEATKRLKKMGSDIVGSMQKVKTEQIEQQDPQFTYDRGFVLEAGLVGWSYDAELNKANIELLDEETARWAFYQIVGLNEKKDDDTVKNS